MSRPRKGRGKHPADRPGAHSWGPESASDSADAGLPTRITSGRMLAWVVLQQSERSDRYLQDLLAEADATHQLSSADRSQAVDLASGIMRRRLTLDWILQHVVSRPLATLEPDLLQLLRLGAQQLVFTATPGHAAVHETVQLCRHLSRERWTQFANGVLRSVQRLLPDDDPTAEGPAADAVPTDPSVWRRLNQPVFPDPVAEPVDYLSRAFSLPPEIAARWHARLSYTELLTACFYCNATPRLVLRVNRRRGSEEDVIRVLREGGREVSPGPLAGSLIVESGGRIEQLPGYAEGWWSVQDSSAMAAAILLAPQRGELILDLCAAPGGKTTHLAELADDDLSITACDVSDSRLRRVRENAERLGLQSIATQRILRDGSDIPAGPFDAALVDVPCSNTGVLNRRPEARWRFRVPDLQELRVVQLRLLENAATVVRPGGRIVYSTCSLEREENDEVVAEFCRRHSQFTVERKQWHVPGQPADGAWQALLVRSSRPA